MSDPKSIERVVERGVHAAKAVLSDTYLSRSGILRVKTKRELRDDEMNLLLMAEVLDLLRWYGDWGSTRHGIKMELIARAKAVASKEER